MSDREMADGGGPDADPSDRRSAEADPGDFGLEAGDAPALVLAPRPVDDAAAGTRKRRLVPLLVLALCVVAGGVLVTQFLSKAVDYYCNADEIGVRDGCEADRRLRVQGTVDEASVEQVSGVTTFSMSFNGVSIPVRYAGEPGGIFQECLPVVVHGEMKDGTFEGDRVEVKHSDEYVADNAERVDPETASAESSACSRPV